MTYDVQSASFRRRGIAGIVAVLVIGLLGYGAYWLVYDRYFESTDDAYVSGDIVEITTEQPGTVSSLHADNTQSVKRGQTLVELDPSTVNIGMQSAEADLARTVRQVRAQFARADALHNAGRNYQPYSGSQRAGQGSYCIERRADEQGLTPPVFVGQRPPDEDARCIKKKEHGQGQVEDRGGR